MTFRSRGGSEAVAAHTRALAVDTVYMLVEERMQRREIIFLTLVFLITREMDLEGQSQLIKGQLSPLTMEWSCI